MKDYVRMMIITAVILLLIPIVGFAAKRSGLPVQAKPESGAGAGGITQDSVLNDTVKMLFTESGEVALLSRRDYVIGAVFAQMPADFAPEALKAQAVLANTYAVRRRLTEQEDPDPALQGADMSDDTSLYQAYFTEAQARAFYGEDYEEAYKRVSEAADSAAGLILCYEDEPVIAAFHGISFGQTESAFTMWGEDIPYLQSVPSLTDAELDICRTSVSFTDEEIAAAVPEFAGEDLSELAPAEKSEHGTVLTLRAGETLADAQAVCERLGLPSAHFTMKRTAAPGWEFTAEGCGHLVGMSQYGADTMAKKGSTCEQILLHYYTDCVFVRTQS